MKFNLTKLGEPIIINKDDIIKKPYLDTSINSPALTKRKSNLMLDYFTIDNVTEESRNHLFDNNTSSLLSPNTKQRKIRLLSPTHNQISSHRGIQKLENKKSNHKKNKTLGSSIDFGKVKNKTFLQ